jgi:ElaB/YqjD/DUF883 family membrane-anchored ribosome-binding protein
MAIRALSASTLTGAIAMASDVPLSPADNKPSEDRETMRAASQTAVSLQSAIMDTIEHQPYTAVAIAFGIGWLFGRRHRPF